jgi:ABC-2 type transport system ATP-binding protein
VGVDPQSRQRIWDMFDELRSRGASLLLATHQLDEAQQKCERIVIIDYGKTLADGSFEDLLSRTIGMQRRVVCHLRGPVPAALQQAGWERRGDSTLIRRVEDLGSELAALLSEMTRASVHVEDLKIESPTLQDVFLHLTGRELRE